MLAKTFFRKYTSLTNTLKVLGIESTCDDTCAAVVTSDRKVLSDVRHTQLQTHLDHGGIIGPIAGTEHVKNINSVTLESLRRANISISDVDAVAVASRPGLELSLHVGVSYAQDLCIKYGKPLINVHHMEAHALTALLTNSDINFPFLTLLISGGHSIIALVTGIDRFYILADASSNPIGETLDKIARRLKIRNLGSPYHQISGGRAIEILAENGNPTAYFNSSYTPKLDSNLSFGNYKPWTDKIIENLYARHPEWPIDCPLPEAADIAASLQRSIVQYIGSHIQAIVKLLESTRLLENPECILEKHPRKLSYSSIDYVKSRPIDIKLVISGGVACNTYIQEKLKEYCEKMDKLYNETQVKVIVPQPKNLCTDNGVMISWNGMLKVLKYGKKCFHSSELEINSVKPISDATLGKDMREFMDLKNFTIKHVDIS